MEGEKITDAALLSFLCTAWVNVDAWAGYLFLVRHGTAYNLPLTEGLNFEKHLFHTLFATKDQKEGMAAFAEKRKPTFSNE